MNDYWNDPPDDAPDPPACPLSEDVKKCSGVGEFLYETKTGWCFSCDTCGYQWVVKFPPEPEPEEVLDHSAWEGLEPQDKPCPHGKTESCDACDHASDIAYDAAREKRK